MINENNYRRMSAEVLEILSMYPEEIRNKIPSKLISELERNKLPNFKVNIDKDKKIYEQDITDEAIVLIYMIYRSYIASPKEKKKFDEILNKFDEETKKKYNPDNLFKNNNSLDYSEK